MKKLIAGNWKMNPQTLEEARRIASGVERSLWGELGSTTEVVICPPLVYLTALKHSLHHARLGAQNLSAEEKGPHTGEISALQLKNLGIQHAIVGHSERRSLGEDDEMINEKLIRCREQGMHPILCVGYGTTKSMSDGRVKNIIAKQLAACLKGLKFANGDFTIAYEPVWAISRGPGTAVAVPTKHTASIIEFIRLQYTGARVIYGGSVTSKNGAELAKFKIIEGGLVGGASLDAQEFLNIIKAFMT